MKMTMIGGGNIGTLMAAEMAHKGHVVTMYTTKIDKWNQSIDVLQANGQHMFTGLLHRVTSDLEQAVKGADIIWITVPAQMFAHLGRQLKQFATKGQKFGIVPGSGGAEFAFRELIEMGCELFGLQRVHSIARLKEYGTSVYMLGRKTELQVGSIPSEKAGEIGTMLEAIFDIPSVALSNYLCVTLTPSNPILHTARLYGMFHAYQKGVVYPRNFFFYEEWTDESSQVMIQCDDELQRLCQVIPLDLQSVISLKVHYGSLTPEAMTRKISGIQAFQGLLSPMTEVEGGWIPDFSSRYFVSDFSFGLKIIRDIAALFAVEVPTIQKVWDWYQSSNPEDACQAFQLCFDQETLINLYRL